MNHDQALAMLKKYKLVAILRNIPLEESLSVARALHAGGVRVMEFTYDHNLPGFMELNNQIHKIFSVKVGKFIIH